MALRKTLATLRTNVRTYLDEAQAGYWTNAQLNGFINESKDRCQQEVKKLQDDYWDVIRTSLDGTVTLASGASYDCASFRLLPGTMVYTGPDDVLELRSARVVTSGYEWIKVLHKDQADLDFRGLRAMTVTLTPAAIYFDQIGESDLLVVPPLDVTLDLELTYVRMIPDLAADGDELEMPHPLYIAVQEYATATALMMDSSPNAAAWEAKGNASVARFFGAANRQTQDIETVRGYMEETF